MGAKLAGAHQMLLTPAGPRKGGKALFLRKSHGEHMDKDNPLGGIQKLQTSHETLAGAEDSLVLTGMLGLSLQPVTITALLLPRPVPSPQQLKLSSF